MRTRFRCGESRRWADLFSQQERSNVLAILGSHAEDELQAEAAIQVKVDLLPAVGDPLATDEPAGPIEEFAGERPHTRSSVGSLSTG